MADKDVNLIQGPGKVVSSLGPDYHWTIQPVSLPLTGENSYFWNGFYWEELKGVPYPISEAAKES